MRSVRDLMGFAPAVHQNNAIAKDPEVLFREVFCPWHEKQRAQECRFS